MSLESLKRRFEHQKHIAWQPGHTGFAFYRAWTQVPRYAAGLSFKPLSPRVVMMIPRLVDNDEFCASVCKTVSVNGVRSSSTGERSLGVWGTGFSRSSAMFASKSLNEIFSGSGTLVTFLGNEEIRIH